VGTAGALASGAGAAQPTEVTPPHALERPVPPYPPSGHGNAAVVLEVVVDRSGDVRDARVVEGSPPFAQAALDAASTMRFSPALRGGRPVDARIRLRVTFVEPSPVTPAGASAPVSSAPPSSAARPQPSPPAPAGSPPIEEVQVRGVRPEPPHLAMTGGEVRELPGSFGDAFRAIEALPGVIPIVSGLPYFLVRGAPPGNTGFFIDGVRVPALFHLGVGTAVIHPDLVDRVDLYSGTYPARFGRFTGGILSGEVLPFPERPKADVSLRLIDAGALVAVPIDGGRGEVMASGRFGYPGPLLAAVAAIADPTAKIDLQYWDYQVRARWRPTDRDEFGVFAFGSFDLLSAVGTAYDVQFHRVDLRWDHRTSRSGKLRVALTAGYDELGGTQTTQVTEGGFGQPMTITTTSTDKVRSGMFGLRSDWSDEVAPGAGLRLGADAIFEPYDVAVPGLTPIGGLSGSISGGPLGFGSSQPAASGFRQYDSNASAYAELTWRPVPALEILPGARVDLFTSRYPGQTGTPQVDAQGRITVDPRLTARWHITPAIAFFSALGVAHQPSNIPLPSPGLNFSQLSRGLQTSYQYSDGFEVNLPWGFSATTDVFMHDDTGLADYYDSCPQGETTCVFDGRAIGLEFMLRRKLTERITGWLSYTLSRVERDSMASNQYGQPPVWTRRLSEFDRTHVLNAVFAADLGNRWRAGIRVEGYSGLPYSSHSIFFNAPPDARAPPFVRVDLRLEKSWRQWGGTMTFVFEWLNALLQKESISTTCSAGTGPQPYAVKCSPQPLPIPITFPSLGLEWRSGEGSPPARFDLESRPPPLPLRNR
jgi:TonB family protein